MFNVGDVVFYSTTGVCEVISIGQPALKGLPTHVDYYTLQPLSLNHREMIYVPTDTKAFMRLAIDAGAAQGFIDMVDSIQPQFPDTRNPKAIQDYYSRLINSFETPKLLQVIVSLTTKKREVHAKNKHLNQTQTTFLRRAQEMVYNELAYALGKTSDDIAQIIESRI
ncbi:MAG: CarD family transcriptional regulator [Oscillospiraceae bacterium]|nr:CarD family transcriptional regulator [Oscillospiraceae bacterium]